MSTVMPTPAPSSAMFTSAATAGTRRRCFGQTQTASSSDAPQSARTAIYTGRQSVYSGSKRDMIKLNVQKTSWTAARKIAALRLSSRMSLRTFSLLFLKTSANSSLFAIFVSIFAPFLCF